MGHMCKVTRWTSEASVCSALCQWRLQNCTPAVQIIRVIKTSRSLLMNSCSKIVRSHSIMKLRGFWLVRDANSRVCTLFWSTGLCLTMMCPPGKGLGEVKVLNVSFWVSLALTLHGRALWAPAGWWTAWSWGWWMMSTRNQNLDLVRLATGKKIPAWILLFLGLSQITYENNVLKMQLLKNSVILPIQRWLELTFIYFD